MMLVLFVLTIMCLWASLFTWMIINELNNIPPIMFIKNAWIIWLWLPIPILSITLGFKYKNIGYKCTKNIVAGFIIGFLLLMYGSFCLLPTYEENYNKIYEYQDIIDLELPDNGMLEVQNINTFDNFDVYGHIDYVARYISDSSYEYSYEQFKEKIDYILKLLIEKGKGIEINTGGYRSKLNAPNPCVDIVKSYNKLGGKIITVGSDAHKIDDFSSDFDKIPNILSQCNFDYYNVFSKRKPVKIPL